LRKPKASHEDGCGPSDGLGNAMGLMRGVVIAGGGGRMRGGLDAKGTPPPRERGSYISIGEKWGRLLSTS